MKVKTTPFPPFPKLPTPTPQPKWPNPGPLPKLPMPIPRFPVEKPTLNLGDRLNATRLPGALQRSLSGIVGALRLANAPDATLRRGKDGSMVGPEGQPLVAVQLKDGKTAYVDPNTNQYYVDENKIAYFRQPDSIRVKGPMDLPKDVQFSNSHFSDADCRQLERDTRGGIFKKLIEGDGFEPEPIWKKALL